MKKYITYLNCGATGEGCFDEINVCLAKNKEESIEKHLDRFNYKIESDRNYFKVGIIVLNVKSLEAKGLLSRFFVDENQIYHIINDKTPVELYFRFYVNNS